MFREREKGKLSENVFSRDWAVAIGGRRELLGFGTGKVLVELYQLLSLVRGTFEMIFNTDIHPDFTSERVNCDYSCAERAYVHTIMQSLCFLHFLRYSSQREIIRRLQKFMKLWTSRLP